MRKITSLLMFVCLFAALSCGDDVLDKQNHNKQSTETFYTTDAEIGSALNGVYAILQSNNLGGREWFFLHDLRGDEMATGGGQLETPRNQLLIGTHDSGNGVVNSVWTGAYRMVLRADAVIQNGPLIEASSPELVARYVAEAKFLRAWIYFQLYMLWGPVPLYTEYADKIDGAKPRSPVADVKAVVVQDLKDAIAVLPNDYAGNDKGRASKIAAQALLAKVYMFDGDYTQAKPLLESAITFGESRAGGTALTAKYFDNFSEETEYNNESVWEISYTSNGNYNWDADGNDYGPNESWIRSQEYSAIGWRNLIPSDKLLAEYEDNDPRLKENFFFTGDKYGDPGALKTLSDGDQRGNGSTFKGNPVKTSWRKYSVMYKLDPGGFYDKIGINHRVMRYADMYLLLAECENEVGSPATAVTLLNKTRLRPSVNMPTYPTAAYPTGSKDQILKAIMHERMVELAGEEVRNFDILRWRKAGKFTTDPITYFSANKYELLPVPLAELDGNASIEGADQNPGY